MSQGKTKQTRSPSFSVADASNQVIVMVSSQFGVSEKVDITRTIGRADRKHEQRNHDDLKGGHCRPPFK
jgi:hypothetical protein